MPLAFDMSFWDTSSGITLYFGGLKRALCRDSRNIRM